MENLIRVISNNFWPTIFVLALVPVATNVYVGLRRRFLNRPWKLFFRGWSPPPWGLWEHIMWGATGEKRLWTDFKISWGFSGPMWKALGPILVVGEKKFLFSFFGPRPLFHCR
jgi:hypothetical protein